MRLLSVNRNVGERMKTFKARFNPP